MAIDDNSVMIDVDLSMMELEAEELMERKKKSDSKQRKEKKEQQGKEGRHDSERCPSGEADIAPSEIGLGRELQETSSIPIRFTL